MDRDAIHRFTVQVEEICESSLSQLRQDIRLKTWLDLSLDDRESLVEALGAAEAQPLKVLHLLHALLSESEGPWPASLVRCHTIITYRIKASSPDIRDSDVLWLLLKTEELIKQSYTSISALIKSSSHPAL
jgi:hypothetical protein